MWQQQHKQQSQQQQQKQQQQQQQLKSQGHVDEDGEEDDEEDEEWIQDIGLHSNLRSKLEAERLQDGGQGTTQVTAANLKKNIFIL